MNIKVQKKYDIFTATLKTSPISVDVDRAVADFRAFEAIGRVHASRVRNDLALDVMLEIVETLQKDLLSQKKVISLS